MIRVERATVVLCWVVWVVACAGPSRPPLTKSPPTKSPIEETVPEADVETLKRALADLRSPDVLTQNEGVDAAIGLGRIAVPSLLRLLTDPNISRAQVMYALAQIGDPRVAEDFAAALHDRDERVRAYAAEGLTRIADPRALAACLQTLNDAADELHADVTPSVEALGEMGLKPISRLLDLLMDNDEMTRLHAERALAMILSRRHGFIPGQGYPSRQAEEDDRAEWHAMGDYDYAADANARAAAVKQWRRWLTSAKP